MIARAFHTTSYLKRTHLLALVGLFIILGIFFTQIPLAHAATGLTIQPVKISQTLNPGDVFNGTILLSNASDKDVDLSITFQDFIPVAGAEGIQFVGRSEGVTSVRDWLSVSSKTDFVFKNKASQEIPYTITVPKDAEPGSHFGVIFFKVSEPSDTGQLKVSTQVGVLVLITIPGQHLQKGNILSFDVPKFIISPPVNFTIKFENTGTVFFEPKGEITIKNMLGHVVGTVPIEGQVVLPTGVKDLHFTWPAGSVLFGRYTAFASVRDGDGNVISSEEKVFYALPIWYIIFFIILVIILYFILKVVRKHVKFV